jgi:hypothetical protein
MTVSRCQLLYRSLVSNRPRHSATALTTGGHNRQRLRAARRSPSSRTCISLIFPFRNLRISNRKPQARRPRKGLRRRSGRQVSRRRRNSQASDGAGLARWDSPCSAGKPVDFWTAVSWLGEPEVWLNSARRRSLPGDTGRRDCRGLSVGSDARAGRTGRSPARGCQRPRRRAVPGATWGGAAGVSRHSWQAAEKALDF